MQLKTISHKSAVIGLLFLLTSITAHSQEKLIYHNIRTDKQGNILPWYNDSPGISYDHILDLVWNFWDTMRVDMNGIPYYMNHQVWEPVVNDPRGLGGDQIQMALSAWHLYYVYSGNERVRENMKFMTDYYLTHGLSPSTAAWPDLPYPYNTLLYSGVYDGDMVIGKNYTQPDKAGSFGCELIRMHKMLNNERYPNTSQKEYLDAAIRIANTLMKQMKAGDENNSPLPFKVNAVTGEVGKLINHSDNTTTLSSYTSNWSGTLELFIDLKKLDADHATSYQKAIDTILAWMKNYPMKNNKWGPFFEDIPGWSDTQINAMTWTRFMMSHRDIFPEWKSDVKKIIEWVYKTLRNDTWSKYGVTAINEQTAYRVPGNSHTSRQAADELYYASLTGDKTNVDRAIRQLNWATYMVDTDGKNQYPQDQNWLTDGYGDYVRHYLRAMAAYPEIAPAGKNHILSSTSIIQLAGYTNEVSEWVIPGVRKVDVKKMIVYYKVYDASGTEVIRLAKKPSAVYLDGNVVAELKSSQSGQGYFWQTLTSGGGTITISRTGGKEVIVLE